MKTLFNGRLWVHYGQAYVVSGPGFDSDLEASFRGQASGLCGASSPNLLFLHGSAHRPREFQRRILRCRTATGPGMGGRRRSLIHSGQPSLPRGVGRPGLVSKDLAPGTYRVRYAARGMDSARAVDTIVETEEPIDTYQLSFWPAKGDAPDRVVRQESQTATYWNGWANSLHPTS